MHVQHLFCKTATYYGKQSACLYSSNTTSVYGLQHTVTAFKVTTPEQIKFGKFFND